MKKLLIIITVLLLSGCGHTFFSQNVRPDQLEFPPLNFKFPQVAKQTLANGVKVYVKEDHELPLVELTVLVEGGGIYDPLDKTGLSDFFAQTLSTGGTEQSTPEDLETELENMAAELSVSSSLYSYEIDISLNREDLSRGIEILAELLRQPRFDKTRMELVRSQMLEQIKRQNDDPGAVAGRLLRQEIYGNHPLGVEPTEATIKNLTRDDLLQVHDRYFKPQNVWLAVSGDVTQAELISQLQKNLGDWNGGEPFLRQFPGGASCGHSRGSVFFRCVAKQAQGYRPVCPETAFAGEYRGFAFWRFERQVEKAEPGVDQRCVEGPAPDSPWLCAATAEKDVWILGQQDCRFAGQRGGQAPAPVAALSRTQR